MTDFDLDSNKLRVVRSLYEDWLYAQAIKIFEAKSRRFAKVIDVKPNKILVKKLKNRWGGATQSGIINLNFNLVIAPEKVIDYVIIHELCHLIIKKHSHHFRKLLRRYINDYKRRIEWLEVNGNYLI